ncbi:hypothetical protein CBM2585_B50196 [Cupriavidus taiwanensis]|nr:hypothetical protein CBM2585_B50196 [Cupriavidus taiwanensis]
METRTGRVPCASILGDDSLF